MSHGSTAVEAFDILSRLFRGTSLNRVELERHSYPYSRRNLPRKFARKCMRRSESQVLNEVHSNSFFTP